MRRAQVLFRGMVALCWSILLLMRPALGIERWVVGNDQRPWSSVGTLVALDDTTEPGWLQPINVTGKNVAVGAEERGGWITTSWSQPRSSIPWAIDGNAETFFPSQYLDHRSGFDVTIILDLGVPFGVDHLSFYTPKGYEDWFLSGYQLFINPRDEKMEKPDLRGSWYPLVKDWDLVAENPIVLDQTVIEEGIPMQVARYVALSDYIHTSERHWTLAELEVWGVGYPLRSWYTSEVVDLGGKVNFGKLRWSGVSDPESWVTLRTRVGTTPDPNLYHKRTGIGPEGQIQVTQAEYGKLRPLEQGTVELDREHWTFWSAPYLSGAEPMVSEGPARYVQCEILFESRSPMVRTRLDSLAIEYTPFLLAQEIVGEIEPSEVVPGQVTAFTYAMRGTFGPGDKGFDGVRILTSEPATVHGVRVDRVPVEFSPEVEVEGFTVRFPGHRVERSGEVVEVEFSCRVLVYGTRFVAEVLDTQTEEIPQRVVPGDASGELESNDTLVRWPLLGGSLLSSVEVSSGVLTPNGDGVNDVVKISYSLLQALDPVPVTVEIYDLSGSLVWWDKAVHVRGHYEVEWDGFRDGERVRPGVYVVRVVAEAQRGDQSHVGTMVVAY